VVTTHLIRAPEALRCCRQAGTSATSLFAGVDASVEALGTQRADFDLDPIEPVRGLWRVVELQALDQAAGRRGRVDLVQRTGGMG